MLLLGFACTAAIYAQPGNGGFMRRSPEERAAAIHQKLDSAFKLDKEVLARLDTALIALYQAQDKKREEMMAGGMPDRETMMAEMKKFSDARDEMPRIAAALVEAADQLAAPDQRRDRHRTRGAGMTGEQQRVQAFVDRPEARAPRPGKEPVQRLARNGDETARPGIRLADGLDQARHFILGIGAGDRNAIDAGESFGDALGNDVNQVGKRG